jgi:hypothetical protein
MRIIGCDLDASQQTIARISRRAHGDARRRDGPGFDQALPALVVVRIEATVSMGWFVRLMEEPASHASWAIRPRSARLTQVGRNTTWRILTGD